MKIVYEADDGTRFNTQLECESFEKKDSLINHINYYCCETYDENYGRAFIQVGNVEDYIMSNISAINEIIESMKK